MGIVRLFPSHQIPGGIKRRRAWIRFSRYLASTGLSSLETTLPYSHSLESLLCQVPVGHHFNILKVACGIIPAIHRLWTSAQHFEGCLWLIPAIHRLWTSAQHSKGCLWSNPGDPPTKHGFIQHGLRRTIHRPLLSGQGR